jgi:CRP-like cAMP-binding protein
VTGQSGHPQKVGHISAGQIVGEMALLSQESRTASVQASEDAEVLRIDESTLIRMNKRFPRMATQVHQNISQILAKRLKNTTQDYVGSLD